MLFFVVKLILLLKLIRELRPLHITPMDLKARMDAGAQIGVFDLLRFEDDPEGSCAIPGAVRADPSKMRHKKHIAMPEGIDLVLYCNLKNNFVTARVAASMRKTGVPRILILEGGLEAWKSAGFPLNADFADPLLELKRLGIEIFPPPWAASDEEIVPTPSSCHRIATGR